MNDVQEPIAELRKRRWTLAAIADEVGVTWRTLKRWDAGDSYPDTHKVVVAALASLLERKRVPKRRRYRSKIEAAG